MKLKPPDLRDLERVSPTVFERIIPLLSILLPSLLCYYGEKVLSPKLTEELSRFVFESVNVRLYIALAEIFPWFIDVFDLLMLPWL